MITKLFQSWGSRKSPGPGKVIIIIICYIYIALFWILKVLYIEGGNLLNHHHHGSHIAPEHPPQTSLLLERRPSDEANQCMGMITRPWWSEANGERLVSFKHFYINILFRRHLFSAHAHTMFIFCRACLWARELYAVSMLRACRWRLIHIMMTDRRQF